MKWSMETTWGLEGEGVGGFASMWRLARSDVVDSDESNNSTNAVLRSETTNHNYVVDLGRISKFQVREICLRSVE